MSGSQAVGYFTRSPGRRVRKEPPSLHVFGGSVHGRQSMLECELGDSLALGKSEGASSDENGFRALPRRGRKGAGQLIRRADAQILQRDPRQPGGSLEVSYGGRRADIVRMPENRQSGHLGKDL